MIPQKYTVQMVPIKDLHPHPDNRKITPEGLDWDEFAASVKDHGIMQPLMSRKMPNGKLQIIAGERRWRAALAAGFESVPAFIRDFDDQETLKFLLIDNLQRADLDVIEEARGVRLLLTKGAMSVAEVSEAIRRSADWVNLRQGLLDLDVEVQERARRRELSLGVVQLLLDLPTDRRSEGVQLVLHSSFQVEPLNVRQSFQVLEDKITGPARAAKEWESRKDALLEKWKKHLREKLNPVVEEPLLVALGEGAVDHNKMMPAERKIGREALTDDAPMNLAWVDLAARHGLPALIFREKDWTEHGDDNDSGAFVYVSLIKTGEDARREHTKDAWLRKKAGAVEEKEEPEKDEPDDDEPEEPTGSQKVRQSAMIDMGKVTAMREFLDSNNYASPPEWARDLMNEIDACPPSLGERVAAITLEWVETLCGSDHQD